MANPNLDTIFKGVDINGKGLSKQDFTDALLRLNRANRNNAGVSFDNCWRTKLTEVSTLTSHSGYGFTAFNPVAVKGIFGTNSTGEVIVIRKTHNLVIKGARNRGSFNPVANTNNPELQGTNLVGVYGDSYRNIYPGLPDTTNMAPGDCLMLDYGTGTGTLAGQTVRSGDLAVVKADKSWGIQQGPGITDGLGAYKRGDFWTVFATRVFGGIQLTVDQRIIFISSEMRGGPGYARFVASKPGEFYLINEANGSFPPVGTTFREGDMYNFSSSTTTPGGFTGVVGDSIVRFNGVTFVLPGEAQTISQNQLINLKCENANEWAVRRQTKNTTRITVAAKAYQGWVQQDASDSLAMFSDSMLEKNETGEKIKNTLGRDGQVKAFGGATSEQILGMMEYFIQNGDPYQGWVHIIWHGQNNIYSELTQTTNAATAMANLVGAVQKRFIFWSVLGARDTSFANGRINCLLFEQAKAGTNVIAQLETFYTESFPKQWWSPRLALIASAVGRNIPDPQFPGQTEEQVAAQYGIVPFSYFFEYSTKPFNASQLTPLGYHGTAGLPSNGIGNNFDCYVRSVAGVTGEVVGNIIVKVSGVWVEYVYDNVHLTIEGSNLVSTAFANYMLSIGL